MSQPKSQSKSQSQPPSQPQSLFQSASAAPSTHAAACHCGTVRFRVTLP